MMVYAVLVLLFGTFLQPITILFSLPLSIGGAIAALLVTGKQLTTPVWIGILMLMGIVTKNAIMLVEFAVEFDAGRQAAPRGDHRRRHEARAPDRHDHDRDGRRHDALGAGVRRRRRIPLADGARRDRRPGLLHRAVAGVRAGDVHADGRHRRADLALRQEAGGLTRRERGGEAGVTPAIAASPRSRRPSCIRRRRSSASAALAHTGPFIRLRGAAANGAEIFCHARGRRVVLPAGRRHDDGHKTLRRAGLAQQRRLQRRSRI